MARITITIDTEDSPDFDAEHGVRRAIADIDWDARLRGYFLNLKIDATRVCTHCNAAAPDDFDEGVDPTCEACSDRLFSAPFATPSASLREVVEIARFAREGSDESL